MLEVKQEPQTGAAAQPVQTERPFNNPSATCRGLLEGYRFSKYSRAAVADWAFLVPHLSTLCTLRARTLVCSTTPKPMSCLDLGSSDKQSLSCITNLPKLALKSVFKILCIVSISRSYPPSCWNFSALVGAAPLLFRGRFRKMAKDTLPRAALSLSFFFLGISASDFLGGTLGGLRSSDFRFFFPAMRVSV